MKIKQHIRVAAQSLLATFFVALVVVAATQAATTIGNNITTGSITTTSPIIIGSTSTSATVLTVDGSTSSTTLAVYQRGAGDIVNVIDGATEVFTILDGGNVGVASSTPNATLAVQAAAGKTAFMVGSTTAELLTINASGVTVGNEDSQAFADLRWEGDSRSDLLMVDASADRVGIGSTTPWGLLAVEQATETYSFLVMNSGSSTPSFVVLGVNGNGNVGIATSSPSAMFAIGSGAATSTVDFGKACFRTTTDSGTTLYWWFTGAPVANDSSFISTSTSSCF